MTEDVRKKFEVCCRRREYASKAQRSALVKGATFGYNSRNEEVERLDGLIGFIHLSIKYMLLW